jgi:hypothetical protein
MILNNACRAGGATGPGVFTVFNLNTQKLKGQLELSTEAGFCLRNKLPAVESPHLKPVPIMQL